MSQVPGRSRRSRAFVTLRPWLVVASVTGATILPSYLNGALTVALPSIGAEIGLGPAELQWPLTVLSLVNGAFLLLSGGLADAFGRRYVFLGGTAWLLVVSLVLAFVKDSNAFIALHALLGLGPALLTPSGTGILGESLPLGKVRNAAFAALGAGQPLGFIIGLLFGGVFGHQYSVIYCINAGAAAVFGVAAATFLPRDGEKVLGVSEPLSDERVGDADEDRASLRRALPLVAFDWGGAALSTSGLIFLTLGVAFAGTDQRGWASIPTIVMLPLSVVLLTAFFSWELKVQRQTSSIEYGQAHQEPTLKAPLIPPGLWRAPRFTATLVVLFFAWLSFNALTYYCTLFFQEVQHIAPLATSVRFLPMIGAGLALNVLGGFVVARVDALYLVLLGSLGGLGSATLFVFLDPKWGYAPGMFMVLILIVSPDIFFPATQLFACHTVGPRRAALAGSLFNVTIRLATSIGLAATSTLATAVSKQYSRAHPLASHEETLLAGYRAAVYMCVGCSATAIVLAATLLRKMGIVGTLGMRAPSSDRGADGIAASSADRDIPLSTASSQRHLNGSASAAASLHGAMTPPSEMGPLDADSIALAHLPKQ